MWLQNLRVGKRALTVAAEQLVALAGCLSGFEEASDKILRKLSGIQLSESTVQRTTKDAGQRLRQMLDAQIDFQEKQSWQWNRDAAGRTCAYVSIDATGVRQQGRRGAKAEGRMPYVGMIYNPPPRSDSGPIKDRRYLAGLYDLTDLGRQLHREALSVGWQDAEVQIALSDGAPCLEKFLATYFPKAQRILDFFHAAEHLAELARTLYNEEEFHETFRRWRGQLKQHGGAAVLAELEVLDPTGWSNEAKAIWQRELGYFRSNVGRMDYPTYLSNGWQIGSGPIEAACKTVINRRLNGTGMRWSAAGTNHLAALRACYLSEPKRWNSFWNASYLQK